MAFKKVTKPNYSGGFNKLFKTYSYRISKLEFPNQHSGWIFLDSLRTKHEHALFFGY